MSMSLYLLGFIILILGIAYGAFLLHVPPHWIAVATIILIGIGVVTGVSNTRQRDPR